MKHLLLLTISCFILSGLADYTISLGNGYRIDRISPQKIEIYGDEAVNDGNENGYNYLYVPTKVTDVWWDNDYIIAKHGI